MWKQGDKVLPPCGIIGEVSEVWYRFTEYGDVDRADPLIQVMAGGATWYYSAHELKEVGAQWGGHQSER